MDTQQVNARPRAASRKAPENRPTSGVIHDNTRHSAAFTVVGNHLSQHRALSLLAIGLAVHIQSLPTGARIGIKHLAARFPESEVRIAAALRELEAAGYLRRSRTRLPDGRVVTRTVSCNQPGPRTPETAVPRSRVRRPADPAPVRQPPTAPAPADVSPPAEPFPVPKPPLAAPVPTTPPADPVPVPVPAPIPVAPPVRVPTPTARTAPPSPLPHPVRHDAERERLASALLGDLRRLSPQLALSEADVAALAPGVAAWLERDAHPDTVRHALTTDLPALVKHPAKLLRHRITALLPPPLPGTQELVPPRPARIVIPMQNCDRCDRAFRSRHPGHCRECRSESAA
ncbi:helix-turn-helix domain-containing protein [Streptomyces sp. NPDC047973]|uniref:helix-turn-helix domain-containing protein n=1 Tax=Streptomyces sp. NPDC047973 TaxID=3155383 RepID=UPI003443E64E